MKLVAVAVAVAHVVGEFQIHPAQIRGIFAEVGGGFVRYFFINGSYIVAFLIVRKIQGIQFKPVERVGNAQVAGLGKPVADELGSVVEPGRKHGGFLVGVLFAHKPEDRPVVVVGGFDVVVGYVVFIEPGTRQ